jgi:flagellar hook-associated protein 2
MATNGISFSGFNGFDFGQVIEAIIQQESQPLTRLQSQEQALKSKDTALVDLGSQIGKLETSVKKLATASAFTGVKVSSSDETILKTTLGDSAIAGHYDIDVTFLAKAQVTTSANGYSATSDVVADGGSISFTINGSTTTAITISAATTLSELKDLINEQESDVMASIVNDGTNNRLVISSRETGEGNGFTVNSSLTYSSGTVVGFAPGQNATTGNTQNSRDAEFTVNGLPITSASNTITNAIPGVSLTLVKDGTASVDVTTDYTTLKDTIKSFVTDYNKLRDFYQKQSSPNSLTGGSMPLANDTILRQALSDIRSTLIGANGNGGRYSYLAEIGIEFGQGGELKFVETTFNSAIGSYASDVKKLFQGTTTVDGQFDLMLDRLENLDSTAGIIKTTRDNLDESLDNYRDRIIAQQMRLDVRRIELTKMYAAADQAISRLNQMQAQLQSIQY